MESNHNQWCYDCRRIAGPWILLFVLKGVQLDGQFYLYEELSKKFIAQGKTPQEVHDNLPKNNGKFYMAQDGHREIKEELECMQLRST